MATKLVHTKLITTVEQQLMINTVIKLEVTNKGVKYVRRKGNN